MNKKYCVLGFNGFFFRVSDPGGYSLVHELKHATVFDNIESALHASNLYNPSLRVIILNLQEEDSRTTIYVNETKKIVIKFKTDYTSLTVVVPQ